MGVSVVIPVWNEVECIGSLLDEIAAQERHIPLAEVIVIDDGSTDATSDVIAARKRALPNLRLIRHSDRKGQSAAICTGIRSATGELIVTLDGDGQNNPADIPLLFALYETESKKTADHVMVAGQRRARKDNLSRRLSSRIANAARRAVLDDGVRDTGCSLKLFRRDDFLSLPHFNHIHRFIPALMKAANVRVALVDVSHRPRAGGTSKYGIWDRLWVGIYDLFGVRWLIRRMIRPVEIRELT